MFLDIMACYALFLRHIAFLEDGHFINVGHSLALSLLSVLLFFSCFVGGG